MAHDEYITSFRVPLDRIPEARKWRVGGKYKITAEVEQTGINKERDYSTEDRPMVVGEKRRKPRYKTMVEFKICDVNAKHEALKKRTSY